MSHIQTSSGALDSIDSITFACLLAGSILGSDLRGLHSQADTAPHMRHDLHRVDRGRHRVHCAALRLEGSRLRDASDRGGAMSHIAGHHLPNIRHHLHVLWSINIHSLFILENLSSKLPMILVICYLWDGGGGGNKWCAPRHDTLDFRVQAGCVSIFVLYELRSN